MIIARLCLPASVYEKELGGRQAARLRGSAGRSEAAQGAARLGKAQRGCARHSPASVVPGVDFYTHHIYTTHKKAPPAVVSASSSVRAGALGAVRVVERPCMKAMPSVPRDIAQARLVAEADAYERQLRLLTQLVSAERRHRVRIESKSLFE